MRKLIFVDRDGTLVHEPKDFQVDRLDKIKLVEGVIPSMLHLIQAGYQFVMVTNQDGLGTAAFPKEDFQLVHDFIVSLFASQGVDFVDTLICPHLEADHCACRKPKAGLLLNYLKDRSIDWEKSAVIGDRMTDLQLAETIGVQGYQLATGGGIWTWKTLSDDLIAKPRIAVVERSTKETRVRVKVNLDGIGQTSVVTGIGFFDHMLDQLGKHSGIDLSITVEGDLQIDDHHTVEDTAIALGQALQSALGDKHGIGRYGFSLPMDECRAEALIDVSGRSITSISIPFSAEKVGELALEMIPHFFQSLSLAGGINLHLSVSSGNNHHMAEASFKAVALALRQAVASSKFGEMPTTKGVL